MKFLRVIAFSFILSFLPQFESGCLPNTKIGCIDDNAGLQCRVKEWLLQYKNLVGGCQALAKQKNFCETHPTEMSSLCCPTYQAQCDSHLEKNVENRDDNNYNRCKMRILGEAATRNETIKEPSDKEFCNLIDEITDAVERLLPRVQAFFDGFGFSRRRSLQSTEQTLAVDKNQYYRNLGTEDLGHILPIVFQLLPDLYTALFPETDISAIEWIKAERKATIFIIGLATRLKKCNHCLDPLVDTILGNLLKPTSSDEDGVSTLNITVSEFSTEVAVILGALGSELANVSQAKDREKSMTFQDFSSDIKNSLGAVIRKDDLGGLFSHVADIIGTIAPQLQNKAWLEQVGRQMADIYTNTFHCGEPKYDVGYIVQKIYSPTISNPSEKETNYLPASENFESIHEDGDDDCFDDVAAFVDTLIHSYTKLQCKEFITNLGCFHDGNILPLEDIVDACRATWTERCALTKDEKSNRLILDDYPEIKGLLTKNDCLNDIDKKEIEGDDGLPLGVVTTSSITEHKPYLILIFTVCIGIIFFN